VVGNAQKPSARYDDGIIVTDVELRVVTTLKGATKPGETLIVTHLGGAVDRVGLTRRQGGGLFVPPILTLHM
jgi:hypothetical protein